MMIFTIAISLLLLNVQGTEDDPFSGMGDRMNQRSPSIKTALQNSKTDEKKGQVQQPVVSQPKESDEEYIRRTFGINAHLAQKPKSSKDILKDAKITDEEDTGPVVRRGSPSQNTATNADAEWVRKNMGVNIATGGFTEPKKQEYQSKGFSRDVIEGWIANIQSYIDRPDNGPEPGYTWSETGDHGPAYYLTDPVAAMDAWVDLCAKWKAQGNADVSELNTWATKGWTTKEIDDYISDQSSTEQRDSLRQTQDEYTQQAVIPEIFSRVPLGQYYPLIRGPAKLKITGKMGAKYSKDCTGPRHHLSKNLDASSDYGDCACSLHDCDAPNDEADCQRGCDEMPGCEIIFYNYDPLGDARCFYLTDAMFNGDELKWDKTDCVRGKGACYQVKNTGKSLANKFTDGENFIATAATSEFTHQTLGLMSLGFVLLVIAGYYLLKMMNKKVLSNVSSATQTLLEEEI